MRRIKDLCSFVKELRSMIADGMTYREAAPELGTTPAYVKTLVYRRKLDLGQKRGKKRDVDLRLRFLTAIELGHDNGGKLARLFKFSRTRANDLIDQLQREGLVRATGKGKGTKLSVTEEWS
jgi:biotin operon repressor